LDVRVARIRELACWWTSASEEARYQALERAAKENTPPLADLRLAIYLAEAEAGQVREG